MTFYDVAWPVWFLVFIVVEGLSLVHDRRDSVKGDTASVHIRRWLHTDTHHGRTAFLVLTIAFVGSFLGWFIPHILGGPQ